MRTPIDRFHEALLGLVAQKTPRRPPVRMALGVIGERVVYRPGVAPQLVEVGVHGVVVGRVGDTLVVDLSTGLGEFVAHIVHWVQETPVPEFTNAEDVDAWLAS